MKVEWWEFWNPASGVVGGAIAGIILAAIVIITVILIYRYFQQ